MEYLLKKKSKINHNHDYIDKLREYKKKVF